MPPLPSADVASAAAAATAPPPTSPGVVRWWDPSRVRWHSIVVLTVWASVIVAGYRIGLDLFNTDYRVHIGNPPIVGTQDIRIGWKLSAAVTLAVAAVAWGPVAARALRWRWLLAASWAAGCAWALALAASAGWSEVAAPLETRYEYPAAIDRVGSPGAFLSSFVDVLPSYPTHVKGHPPGFLLLLAGLDDIGLGSVTFFALLCVGVGALVAPAALIAIRALADGATARRAAPFLAFTPAAVWVATSGDAFFAGVTACGIALVAVAASAEGGRRRLLAALAGGLVLGGALHLSYGIAPLGLVVAAVLAYRRAYAVAVVAGAGVLAVFAAFVASGFWWLDGLNATRELYFAGVASKRPYAEFLLINVAAFFVALGPAALAGVARLRDRRVWVLAGAALATVMASELSGLSRGETERIWLPFVPWILVASVSLGASRRWLALQVILAVIVQATARTPW